MKTLLAEREGPPKALVFGPDPSALMVESARTVAEALLAEHPEAAERHLERWLGGRADFLKA